MEINGNKKNSEAKIRANNKYRSSHYKRLSLDLRPADFALIDNYARGRGISKAALITRAVRYCIGHNIDLTTDDGGNYIGAAEDIGD